MSETTSQVKVEINTSESEIEIIGKSFNATIALKGANLYSWKVGQLERPLLYTSPSAEQYPNRPLRGGIPVVGPWFAAYSALPQRPVFPSDVAPMAHGFLRECNWEVVETKTVDAGKSQQVTLGLTVSQWQQQLTQLHPRLAAHLSLLPSFDVSLQYLISATSLSSKLTYHAYETGIFEAALHTYLQVENICNYELVGLSEQPYLDATIPDPHGMYGFTAKQQQGDIRFGKMVDRIYESPSKPLYLKPIHGDSVDLPVIEIDNDDATQVVVWNIGPEAVTNLVDMPAEDWQKYICVEAACIRQGAVCLQAGEEFSLQQKISLSV